MAVKEKYKEQLLKIIHKRIPSATVYLFGSRATNQEKPGSDIDLAIDTGKSINYQIIIKILCDLDETTIPLNVDIVDLQTAPVQLKETILREGIKWTN